MNSETIKGRLSQHVKRRLQSQKSSENKIEPQQLSRIATPVLPNPPLIKVEETESPSVKLVKRRKMTKKLSTQSNESNPDDDDKCEKRNEKPDTSLDILTLILNHKKSELLRNSQIMEVLKDVNKKKRTVFTEPNQS